MNVEPSPMKPEPLPGAPSRKSPRPTAPRPLLARVGLLYTRLALHLLNTVLLILLLNGVCLVVFALKDAASPRSAPVSLLSKPVIERFARGFPNYSREDLWDLAVIHSTSGYEYEPYTEYRMRPVRHRFLNVSESGFRLIRDQAAWPPDAKAYRIFVFGGSTTFGMLARDEDTIPSRLQEALRAALPGKHLCVYNFGRVAYCRTQERILLEKLLVAGAVPDAVVFIDGLNDGSVVDDEPLVAPTIRKAFLKADETPPPSVMVWARATPLGRAAGVVRRLLYHEAQEEAAGTTQEKPAASYRDPREVNRVIGRLLGNQRLIRALCKEYGVRPMFVWQPVPTYHYDLKRHPLYTGLESYFGQNWRSRYVYEAIRRRYPERALGTDVLWLGDLQQEVREGPLYLDSVHYTPAFSRVIAGRIAQALLERHVVAR